MKVIFKLPTTCKIQCRKSSIEQLLDKSKSLYASMTYDESNILRGGVVAYYRRGGVWILTAMRAIAIDKVLAEIKLAESGTAKG
jgi:hypothetical protein